MFNNQNYDEYIRSILGYSTNNGMNTIYSNGYQQVPIRQYDESLWDRNDDMPRQDLEECYPDIYKLLYPIVQKTCNENTKPITKELVEEMTKKIYNSVETNNEIQININLQNQINNRDTQSTKETKETRSINRNLSDLIKILILRELLRRPGHRPPVPPRPPRPPFPPMRPPHNRDFDIYEY